MLLLDKNIAKLEQKLILYIQKKNRSSMIWTRAERAPYKQVTIVTKQLIYCQSTQLYTHFLLRVFSVLRGNLI